MRDYFFSNEFARNTLKASTDVKISPFSEKNIEGEAVDDKMDL